MGFYSKPASSDHPLFSNTPCWAMSSPTLGWRGETRPNFLPCVLIPALEGEPGVPGPVLSAGLGICPPSHPGTSFAPGAHQGVGRRRRLGDVSVGQVTEPRDDEAHGEEDGAREGVRPRPIWESTGARAGRLRPGTGLGPVLCECWGLGAFPPCPLWPGLGRPLLPPGCAGLGQEHEERAAY